MVVKVSVVVMATTDLPALDHKARPVLASRSVFITSTFNYNAEEGPLVLSVQLLCTSCVHGLA